MRQLSKDKYEFWVSGYAPAEIQDGVGFHWRPLRYRLRMPNRLNTAEDWERLEKSLQEVEQSKELMITYVQFIRKISWFELWFEAGNKQNGVTT